MLLQESNSILQIHEIEGDKMKGQIVRINSFGMIGGLRQKRDGITFFGYNHENINNNDLNDFLFHQDGILSTENNRILKIRFDKSKNLLM